MRRRETILVILLAAAIAEAVCRAAPPAVANNQRQITTEDLQANLVPHPRILLTREREAALREKVRKTAWAASLEAELEKLADELLAGKKVEGWRPKEWELAGTGSVSRVSSLALAYRLGGDVKYLREAERSLRQIAHEAMIEGVRVEYLKRAAVLTALGIGFDWLHDDLSAETLDRIEQGILQGGLVDLIEQDKYRIPGNNWTTVCYGGTAIAALAIAERRPELAAAALTRAVRLLPSITQQYEPDGISFEGPHYWDFPTMYHALLADSLETALDNDFGLATAPGLRQSFRWRLAARGPSGDDCAFGDGERVNRAVQAMAWAARQYDLDYLVTRADLRRMMRPPERFRGKTWMAFSLIWLPADAVDESPPEDLLAFRGGGPSANVIFRSAWNDPEALWLAIKAGRANVSHGHMDVGSFILEAGGVRWFEELTTHHYYAKPFRDHGITDIWSYDDRQSDRWKVYAWNNRGHNTLTTGYDLHNPNAMAEIVSFDGTPGRYATTIELADVLGERVAQATRTFRVPDDRTVLIEDDWTASDEPFVMTARFHTFAKVDRRGGREAIFSIGSRSLTFRVEQPKEAELVIAPVTDYMNPWDRRLQGLTAIDVRVPTDKRQDRPLRVHLSLQE